MSLKNATFNITIIVSTTTINVAVWKCGLYFLTTYVNKSVPPVEAVALRTNAVPIPIKIPP